MAQTQTELNNSTTYKIKAIDNHIELISIVSSNFLSMLPNNIAKAALIDLPGNLQEAPDLYKSSISFTGYSIRSTIKGSLREIFDLTDQNTFSYSLSSLVAGFSGGAFKYYLTGQNPYVGMLNNAAYELCNDSEYCSNNMETFTIIVEALDAIAQISISLTTGNYVGTTISTIKLSNALMSGIEAGFFINYNADNFYVPFVKEVSDEITELSGEEHNYDYE